MEAASNAKGWRSGSSSLFWLALLGTTLWRAAAAGRFDLSHDEGYYHYWSLFPSLSYYDHPPLTAWAMHLSGRLLGDTVWAVRGWPLLGGIATALLARRLGRLAFGPEAGNRAGLLIALAPVFLGNGLFMTPDALLVPAWAAALLCTWNALHAGGRPWPWWLAAGLAAGVGLLAKYTMILYFLGLGLLWLLSPGRRGALFRGGLLAGVVALALFAPVLVWNHGQGWEPFLFQLRHGFQGKGASAFSTAAEYLGGLLLLATPLAGGAALWLGLRGLAAQDYRRRFLGAFLAAVVLFFGYSSLKAPVQGNWPMAAFVSGLVLLAGSWEALGARLRAWALGLLLALDGAGAVYALLPAGFGVAVGGIVLDPPRYQELLNGPELGESVRARMRESGAELLCVTTHQLFGRVSFYAPELRGRLWLLTDAARMRFPWIDDRRWEGSRALILAHKPMDDPGRGRFRSVEYLGRELFPDRRGRRSEVHYSLGEGYRP